MLAVLAEQLIALEEFAAPSDVSEPIQAVPRERRLQVYSFYYHPGILANNQRKDLLSHWEQDPPTMSMSYQFPCDPLEPHVPPATHVVSLRLKPYRGAGGFGMKSTFWYPISKVSTILDEEVPEETKFLDGPNMGDVALHGTVNKDLRSMIYLRYLSISMEDDLS